MQQRLAPLAVLALWVVIAGTGNPTAVRAQEGPRSFTFTAEEASRSPHLIRVVATARANDQGDTAHVRLWLPDDVRLASGETSWSGILQHGRPQNVEAIVRVEGSGYYEVSGVLTSDSLLADSLFRYRSLQIQRFAFEVTPTGVIPNSRPPDRWHHPAASTGFAPSENGEGVLESTLMLSRIPAVGDTFTVTYMVKALRPITSSRMQVNLVFPPRAFEVLRGLGPRGSVPHVYQGEASTQLTYVGPPPVPGETLEISARLRVLDVGEGDLRGDANFQLPYINDARITVLHVDRYRSWAREVPMSEAVSTRSTFRIEAVPPRE